MAKRSTLDRARKLLRARRFSEVIKLLEVNIVEGTGAEYRQSFDFFYLLAVACMYQGDMGGADTYLQQARKIKMRDTRLLLAEGAFFLRRGDTARAVEYYLEALDSEPRNKTAKRALKFIKSSAGHDVITRMIETDKIKKFFPPLGVHPAVKGFSLLAVLMLTAAAVVLYAVLPLGAGRNAERADLSAFYLTGEEAKNAVEKDLSTGVYRYFLSEKQINDSYRAALRYFQQTRDNAAQVEINRVLNSNAAVSIRQKARLLMDYLAEPTFDSLTDSYAYKTVAADPALYLDCFVSWSGRVTNMREDALQCDLLVGYDTLQTVEGIVPLIFDAPLNIDTGQSVRVLGRIVLQNNALALAVKSVYQPLPPQR
jgi:tetratricopeptide (TPR) repeat protein